MAMMWKNSATSFAAAIVLFMALVSMAQTMNANVAIGNAFGSPTQFTCHSNALARRTYTATSNEIFYFGFDTTEHQFWDCHVSNVGFAKSGTFRFWADDSHGGPQLWGCVNCKWNVDQFEVSIYHDNQWQYMYSWPRSSATGGNYTTIHRKLLSDLAVPQ